MKKFLSTSILISALFISGCDVMYHSKITVDVDYMNSLKIRNNNDQKSLEQLFDEYCVLNDFPKKNTEFPLLDEGTEVIKACGKAWFYSATLFKKSNTYEINLQLLQPGPYRTETEFFCSESSKMNSFFTENLDKNSITIQTYSGCENL